MNKSSAQRMKPSGPGFESQPHSYLSVLVTLTSTVLCSVEDGGAGWGMRSPSLVRIVVRLSYWKLEFVSVSVRLFAVY